MCGLCGALPGSVSEAFEQRETLTRLTFDPGANRNPVWTPDGVRLAFSAQREGSENIYWQAADGSGAPEALTELPNAGISPRSFSPDGTQLLFAVNTAPRDIHLLRLDAGHEPEPLLAGSFDETGAVISPDGRWVAYESNESGRREVFVRPFPDVNSGRWQISTEGGTRPLWNPNRQELFYYVPPGTIMAVPIEAGASFTPGTPEVVFQGQYIASQAGRQYSVSPDGQRFLMIKEIGADGDAPQPQINVVLNWHQELLERVPVP